MSKDGFTFSASAPPGCLTSAGFAISVALAFFVFSRYDNPIWGILVLLFGWLVANKISGKETLAILEKSANLVKSIRSFGLWNNLGRLPDPTSNDKEKIEDDK